MGLDSYFKVNRQPEGSNEGGGDVYVDPTFTFNPPLALCGGMMSGDGNDGSFRGKVYAGMVQDVTGESLYQESIPHERVVEMAVALREWFQTEFGNDKLERAAACYDTSPQEIVDLVVLFEAAAATPNCDLLGWS